MTKEKCGCCGEKTLAIVKHHISYYPEKVIEICANCHSIIHNPPTNPKAPPATNVIEPNESV